MLGLPVKKGKTYRYYSPIKHRRFGAWASSHGPLPAAPIEELVTQQIVAALSAPHIVQSVWDRMQHIRPDLTEPQVVVPMRDVAAMWQQLVPAEQCRLAQLLIERAVIADSGLQSVDAGNHLMPATPRFFWLMWVLRMGTRVCTLASKLCRHIVCNFFNAFSFR